MPAEENKGPKSPEELGISQQEWVVLAESLLSSRQWVSVLPYGELAVYHQMRVDYLEKYFGIDTTIPSSTSSQSSEREGSSMGL